MKIKHCLEFYADNAWFLKDSISVDPLRSFKNRRILFGECPICDKQIVVFEQQRIVDNKLFSTIKSKKELKNLLDKEKNNILYKNSSITRKRNLGWVFGINKEIKDKQGNITQIRQYACSFYGQKEKIKELKLRH